MSLTIKVALMGVLRKSGRKILLFAWGNSNGHIVKCITLAKHAANLGWQPTIVTYDNPVHLQLIEVAGFEAKLYPKTVVIPDDWWLCWLDDSYLHTAIQADLELISELDADVVVHDNRLSVVVSSNIAGVGCGSICRQINCLGFEYPGLPKNRLWIDGALSFNRVLNSLDQPPISNDMREIYLRSTTLVPSIPDLDPLPLGFPTSAARYVGPLTATSFDRSPSRPPPKRRNRPGATGVFFYRTVGDNNRFEEFCEVFEDISDRVYIATGDDALTESLRARCKGSGFHIQSLCDISKIAPFVDAAVHHGGHGTMLSCIENSIPAVILPGKNPERNVNASRAFELGLGRLIASEGARFDISWGQSVAASGDMPDWRSMRALLDAIVGDKGITEGLQTMRAQLQEFDSDVVGNALMELYEATHNRNTEANALSERSISEL